MGNTPARSCDPYLPATVAFLTGRQCAASLVQLVIDDHNKRPSKATLENMFAEKNLFQEQTVAFVISRLAVAWEKTSRTEGWPFPDEICTFDHLIVDLSSAIISESKRRNIAVDSVLAELGDFLNCPSSFIAAARDGVPLPMSFCEKLVTASSCWREHALHRLTIVRADSAAPNLDRNLRRMFLNYMYPDRDIYFRQKKASQGSFDFSNVANIRGKVTSGSPIRNAS